MTEPGIGWDQNSTMKKKKNDIDLLRCPNPYQHHYLSILNAYFPAKTKNDWTVSSEEIIADKKMLQDD